MTTLFLDSLTLLPAIRDRLDLTAPLRVVDVGAGAGFPSLPLEILFPHWDLTLVESVGKKAAFLRQVAAELGLNRVTVLNSRAETAVSPGLRDSADLCLARAVSALPSLVELCAPFVRPGGILLFPKSGAIEKEIRASDPAAARLGCRLSGVVPVSDSLHLGEGRVLIVYDKVRSTPAAFPRRVGLAQSQPISAD
jgi:16S rRNA (guanine527-N7)-methyltransferase